MRRLYLDPSNFADEKKKILSFLIVVVSFQLSRTGRSELFDSRTLLPWVGTLYTSVSSITYYGLAFVLYSSSVTILVEFVFNTSILEINMHIYAFVLFSAIRYMQLLAQETIASYDGFCPDIQLCAQTPSAIRTFFKIGSVLTSFVCVILYTIWAYIQVRREDRRVSEQSRRSTTRTR